VGGHRYHAALLPFFLKQSNLFRLQRCRPPLSLVGGENLQRSTADLSDPVKGEMPAAGNRLMGPE
jgi:hypothetical protein